MIGYYIDPRSAARQVEIACAASILRMAAALDDQQETQQEAER